MTEQSKVKHVRLSEMKTDPRVNRPLDKNWVNYLVKNWDEAQFGTPVVSAYNGHWVIIDGQHRLAALRELTTDDPRVRVEAFEGQGVRENAKGFLGHNKRRGTKAFDAFRIAVHAEDPDALYIMATLKELGLHLDLGGSDGSVACVVQLLKMMRADPSGETLVTVLRYPIECWGMNSAGFQGDILTGFFQFHQRFPQANGTRLVTQVAKSAGGASGLLGKGRTLREINGGTVGSGVAEQLRLLYNRGLRTAQLEL